MSDPKTFYSKIDRAQFKELLNLLDDRGDAYGLNRYDESIDKREAMEFVLATDGIGGAEFRVILRDDGTWVPTVRVQV